MKVSLIAILLAAATALASLADGGPASKAAPAPAEGGAPPATRFLTAVNIEYEGTKVWVPATLILRKGDAVKLTLVNNAPSGDHGFSIDEFGVHQVVPGKGKKTVEFKADKAGLFRSYCQMHPAHVAGQVLVLE